jgi:hypothetical protein
MKCMSIPSNSLGSAPMKMAARMDKKSSGSGFSSIFSSVANGISNLFGSSEKSVPMASMASKERMMAPPSQAVARKR